MMPERIFADRYGRFGVKEYSGEHEYIRADIHEAAVRDAVEAYRASMQSTVVSEHVEAARREEREACAQIAQDLLDEAGFVTRGMREAVIDARETSTGGRE